MLVVGHGHVGDVAADLRRDREAARARRRRRRWIYSCAPRASRQAADRRDDQRHAATLASSQCSCKRSRNDGFDCRWPSAARLSCGPSEAAIARAAAPATQAFPRKSRAFWSGRPLRLTSEKLTLVLRTRRLLVPAGPDTITAPGSHGFEMNLRRVPAMVVRRICWAGPVRSARRRNSRRSHGFPRPRSSSTRSRRGIWARRATGPR